jgi:hypothetical protein
MLLCSNELFVVLADIRSLSLNVRYRGQPGQHMLVPSITGFDPNPVSRIEIPSASIPCAARASLPLGQIIKIGYHCGADVFRAGMA